jgi:hypothetical protein
VVAGGGGADDQCREAGGQAVIAGILEVGADPGDGRAERGERDRPLILFTLRGLYLTNCDDVSYLLF